MTDPRRASHPAPPGLPDASALASTPHVVVVGAGIAGLAAATGLVERGVTVDVVEREPYLGGRVGGWTEKADDGTDLPMNRGFHAFFRQYYNLRDLLRRIDSGLGMLTAVEDYPLVDGQGRRDTFRGLPQTPPLNALAFALRSPTFRLRDLVRLNARAAAPLAAVSVPDIYERLDHLDADSFLRDINFPDAARHLAFEVFSRSFFAEPADLSAAELATMFHIYFLGSSEGLIFDVANANFDVALWNPLREYLESRGARFHTGVLGHRGEHRSALARALRRRRRTSSATESCWPPTWPACSASSTAHPASVTTDWRARVAALGTAPPFVVQRLWLDRPVQADRSAFLGTGGRPPLDNVSVLERYEREAAAWARRTGGSVVELHSYAVTGPPDGLRDRMLARLHELYPETAGRRHRRRTGAVPQRLSAVRARRPRRTADRRHSASRGRAGRRRHPHRPAGGADGTRRDDGLVGGQPAARPLRAGRATPCTRCRSRAGPAPCGGSRSGKGSRCDEHARRPEGASGRKPRRSKCFRASSGRASGPPTRTPSPRSSTPRWSGRSAGRAATGTRSPPATSIRKRPLGTSVGGLEIVAWRDTDGTLHVGPATCPHLGADLATGTVDCGALICPWHGLRLAGRPRIRLEALSRRTTTGCWRGCGWTASAARSRPTCRSCPRDPTAPDLHAVTRLVGTCEPSDIIANRLDPWHGAWYHPYSFAAARRAVGAAGRRRPTRGPGPLPGAGDVPHRPLRSSGRRRVHQPRSRAPS